MNGAEKLTQLAEKHYASGRCGSIVLRVSTGNGRFECSASAGPASIVDSQPINASSPFFIASATKLYTAAIVLQLVDEGVFKLGDRVASLIPKVDMSGIHCIRGVDRGAEITVQHLMAHTSGLADYFEQGQAGGSSIMGQLAAGNDRSWTLDDVLEMNRTRLKARFIPGTRKKAFYSDTNYQLLGAVIEYVTNSSYAENIETRVTRPLGLANTYVFSPLHVQRYDSIAAMKYGAQTLRIPQAMASFGPDGGIVSTADECMIFLKAFMRGEIFQKHHLDDIQVWNRIFFPLQYGIGIMKFQLPRFFSPFSPLPLFIGHSGASGTILFYCPARDVYFCGTVNQTKQRDLPYRMMMHALGYVD